MPLQEELQPHNNPHQACQHSTLHTNAHDVHAAQQEHATAQNTSSSRHILLLLSC